MGFFLIEIGVSLIASIAVVIFWSNPLRNLLESVCEKQEGVNFWLNYSNLMLIITPLLFVIIFSNSSEPGVTDLEVVKRAVSCALFGIFCSVVVIGMYLTNFNKKPTDTIYPSHYVPKPTKKNEENT